MRSKEKGATYPTGNKKFLIFVNFMKAIQSTLGLVRMNQSKEVACHKTNLLFGNPLLV